ncbi:MAG TPA: sugar phosphate isomerase/epimerase [Flavitalea sp.]|nr:sugar phosphate isomerase/epimerase [Flavitalea sp.]
MHTRRNFLKSTAVLVAAPLIYNQSFAHSRFALPAPGVQLFTFFNTIDNDVPGTLKQIADAGYKNIESAFSKKGGFYGMKPKEFAAMLSGLGLSWKSHHVIGAPFKMPANAKPILDANGKPITIPPMKNLRDNMQELVDAVAEGGAEYIVCATSPMGTGQEISDSIGVLNKSAEAAKKAGLKFAYHNHDAEFKTVEGKIPYERLLSDTDASLVKLELDVAWSVKGGANPVELFSKHPGRFPLWHVKDLDAKRETILPLGEGTIDYVPVFKAASTAGLEYFFIEHDMPKDPFESIRKSMAALKKFS